MTRHNSLESNQMEALSSIFWRTQAYALHDVGSTFRMAKKINFSKSKHNNWSECQKNDVFNTAFQSVFIAAGSETDRM